MTSSLLAVVFLFCLSFPTSLQAIPSDPLPVAAYYYEAHQDYRQALGLWSEVLRRQSNSVAAALKVAELKLMFEGRAAERDCLLSFLTENSSLLSVEARKLVRDRLELLQQLFLTDEGQNFFFQGYAKLSRNDCVGALPLFAQAAQLENGNVRVLKAKAKCERMTKAYRFSYESLSLAFEYDPFNAQVAEVLAEARNYYREYEKVVALYRTNPELFRTARAQAAYGIALEESGERDTAFRRLEGLIEQQKLGSVHPAVLFALGRLLSKRSGSATEAQFFLERFLSMASRPNSYLIEGWDPYHTDEKILEARKLLGLLRTKG